MSAAGLPLRRDLAVRLPPLRPRRSARRVSRRGWRRPALALSLLLHLLAGWWLLFGLPPREMPEASSPSAMEMVFEGGAQEDLPAPPAEGAPAPLEPPVPGALPLPTPSAPMPAAPPAAELPPVPRVAEAPPPPAAFAPPAPDLPAPALPIPAPPSAAPPSPPPVVQAPPALPAPAPPLAEPLPPVARALPLPPLPSGPAPSELSLPPPPPPAEAQPEPEVAALPLPPPPAPTPPAVPPETAQARPAPRPPQPAPARPRPAPASPFANSPFAGALDLSQGPPVTLSRPQAPSAPGGAGLRRDREAAAPNTTANADAPNAQLRIRGANLGADWRSAFMAWLRQHGYYPRQAAEAGEDGTAVVRFTVDRAGRVSGLQLIGRSGSVWLDAGAQALLRGRSVPPFPTSTREDSAEIDLTINYILRRR